MSEAPPQASSTDDSDKKATTQQKSTLMQASTDHVRAESAYSMDSFVLDAAPSRDSADMEASANNDSAIAKARTYLSPSSSTTVSENETPAAQPQFQRADSGSFVVHHETIDEPSTSLQRPHSGSEGGNGSVGDKMIMQPPTPFFSPSFYIDDSEVSDGSLVVHDNSPYFSSKQPRLHASAVAQQRKNGDMRERFPSFDSVGSSGSVRYVPPGSRMPTQHQPPPPSVPLNPQMIGQLPYHERRKLMAQRREQDHGGQLQQPPLSSPFAGGIPPTAQQHQQAPRRPPPPMQHPHYNNMMPPYAHPEMGFYQNAMPYPPNYPPPPGMPMHPYGNYHPAGGMYNPVAPPPPFGSPPMPHYPPPPAGMGKPAPPPERPPESIGSQHKALSLPSPSSRVASVGAPPRSNDGIQQQQPINYPPSVQGRSNSNSLGGDSPDGRGGGEVAALYVSKPRSSSSSNASGTVGSLPPPPPPQPPVNLQHARNDSVGSVSSLGSIDRSSHSESDDPRRRSRRGNFLSRLNPWTAKKPNVDDYHRRNQDFLRRASTEKQRVVQSPSATSGVRRRSLDHPPPSRGTHKRLPSIDNDDWEEKEDKEQRLLRQKGDVESTKRISRRQHHPHHRQDHHSAHYSDDNEDEQDYSSSEESGYKRERDSSLDRYAGDLQGSSSADEEGAAAGFPSDERTKLLPPSGISSNENYDGMRRTGRGSSSRAHLAQRESTNSDIYGSVTTQRLDNTTTAALDEIEYEQARRQRRKKKRHKNRSRRGRQDIAEDTTTAGSNSDASISSSSVSSQDYQRFMKKRSRLLEKERAKFIKQWRAEARAEEEAAQLEEENNKWSRQLGRYLETEFGSFMETAFVFYAWAEAFVANLPMTIAAIALAIANLGVVWFKFAEEMMDSCEPVHFHSSQCTFPEFPGCFYCDTSATMYKVALNFHWSCSIIGGILASSLICKLFLARQVVFDELSSPTTATPAGLLCTTLDVVFAGRGIIGQVVVSVASSIHMCLAIWFIYMALAYHIMPEPSWFPNTTALGISAVKTWLYYPMAGHFLMAISLALNFLFFPISLIRVAINKKISATVGWMQMSAPNVSLYALTLMAQPSFREEHPDITRFQVVHRMVYLPCMHFLFAMCILGMCASVHSLVVRWKEFKMFPFSPAHAAFCVPTLSHANAIQAYRAAVNSFSHGAARTPYKFALFSYWVVVLVGGTIVTLWISAKFLASLPAWTHLDTDDEIEPPAPYETAMTSSNLINTGETLVQNFVSPAILQANETGALVLSRNNEGEQVFRRTRKITALGFEPIMSELQMDIEREILLGWVARNPPRRRHRTLSVPGIDFSYGYGHSFGAGNTGVYGMDVGSGSPWQRDRANTSSPYVSQGRKEYPFRPEDQA